VWVQAGVEPVMFFNALRLNSQIRYLERPDQLSVQFEGEAFEQSKCHITAV
jgi:hypothetical protein